VKTTEDRGVAAGHSVDPAGWRPVFGEAMARIAGRFQRVETRRTARPMVLRLLSNVERKTCWTLAEHAGLARPETMQRLLRTARWDAEAVRGFVIEHLGDRQAVLIPQNARAGTAPATQSTAAVTRHYPRWGKTWPMPNSA
jgi:SRSO17 transposase